MGYKENTFLLKRYLFCCRNEQRLLKVDFEYKTVHSVANTTVAPVHEARLWTRSSSSRTSWERLTQFFVPSELYLEKEKKRLQTSTRILVSTLFYNRLHTWKTQLEKKYQLRWTHPPPLSYVTPNKRIRSANTHPHLLELTPFFSWFVKIILPKSIQEMQRYQYLLLSNSNKQYFTTDTT